MAALVMTAKYDGAHGLRKLWHRCSHGPLSYIAFAVLAPAAAFRVAIVVAAAFGVDVSLGRTGASDEFPSLPVAVYWIANLFFYGFGEEIGWRGFALPRFAEVATATLVIGRINVAGAPQVLLWGLWHIPLFSFSAGLGTMPLIGLIGWAASLVTGSVVCTWLFNSTKGSIAVVALFHAALDIFIGSPTGGDVVPNVMGAAVVIGALLIPRRYGRETLSRRPKVIEGWNGDGPGGGGAVGFSGVEAEGAAVMFRPDR